MIYLDNAATTYPKPDIVYEKLDYAIKNNAFNAGRGHYYQAQNAFNIIQTTREYLIEKSNAQSLVFTASATHALNQIIQGINFETNDIIYCSPYDHNAVARTLHAMRVSKKVQLKLIPLNNDLSIDLNKFQFDCITDKPKAVFCSHVSNVTGYILPIHDLGIIAKENGSLFIVDGAQAFGIVPVDLKRDYIDYYVFAGHKTLYGPFGIGGYLAINNNLQLSVFGGTGSDSLNLEMPLEDPLRYEPSSPNVVAIAGLLAGAQWVFSKNILEHEQQLIQYAINKLKAIDEIIIHDESLENRLGIISINIKGIKSEDVASILANDYDICVRGGYHCAPFIHDFIDSKKYSGTVRISFSYFTTITEIDNIIRAIEDIILEV